MSLSVSPSLSIDRRIVRFDLAIGLLPTVEHVSYSLIHSTMPIVKDCTIAHGYIYNGEVVCDRLSACSDLVVCPFMKVRVVIFVGDG